MRLSAAAAQAGPAFSFGLATKLADAVAKRPAETSSPAPDDTHVGEAARATSSQGGDDEAYAAAASALAGAGPALAPFATRPVLELADEIAARFPECTQAPGAAEQALAEAAANAPPAAEQAPPKLSRAASMSRRMGRKAPSAPALGAA